ncbi:hypothetical protein BBBOND_0208880 [Babesia bigemina]|uniref:Uncharacterized protein n=1 Tax=Babesia bigemina TaxID=5866 RepID=A0A061D9Z7_BABBI|nr:hypothetical protein BBBOND_0208880 [Babesia bigemina]CDR95734.1 hypothetical protein BBBOND_0208880 [Babesia bigemina]|eukprot:XP_012767920.1 hypothetical protein BBBOND_0208880 [Babesia bigemina]
MASVKRGSWAGSSLFCRAIGWTSLLLALISFSSVSNCVTVRRSILKKTVAHTTGHTSIGDMPSTDTYPVGSLPEAKLEEQAAANTINKYKANAARDEQDDNDDEEQQANDDSSEVPRLYEVSSSEGEGEGDELSEPDATADNALDGDNDNDNANDAADDGDDGKDGDDENVDSADVPKSYLEQDSQRILSLPNHPNIHLLGREYEPPSKHPKLQKVRRVVRGMSRLGAEYAQKGLRTARDVYRQHAPIIADKAKKVAKRFKNFVTKRNRE